MCVFEYFCILLSGKKSILRGKIVPRKKFPDTQQLFSLTSSFFPSLSLSLFLILSTPPSITCTTILSNVNIISNEKLALLLLWWWWWWQWKLGPSPWKMEKNLLGGGKSIYEQAVEKLEPKLIKALIFGVFAVSSCFSLIL